MIAGNIIDNIKSNKKEISWLLRDKYHWQSPEIYTFFDNFSLQNLPQPIVQDIKKIVNGEPVNYVIGYLNFLGCHIDLSLKPLIPRPETEYWVEKVIEKYKEHKNLSVLDLCCGSGCIGIAVLKNISHSQVDFVDIDPIALRQTQMNLTLNKIESSRFSLRKSNLFENVTPSQYDLILTNPPYVDSNGEFDPGIKHEPPIALFTADSGLYLIKQILSNFSKYLKPSGSIYLEHGGNQSEAILSFASSLSLFPEMHKDQFSADRYLSLT